MNEGKSFGAGGVPQDLMKQLGVRLKHFRKLRGVSQVELARAIGYTSTGTISLIEQGECGMELSKLMLAADYLQVNPATLLTGNELTTAQLEVLDRFIKVLQTIDNKETFDALLTVLESMKK